MNASPPTADLASLIARIALRERAAFEPLYRATCAHLLGVAIRLLNDRDRAEAVLQEAFMNRRAVSLEAAPAAAGGAPSGAFALIGPCVKLW